MRVQKDNVELFGEIPTWTPFDLDAFNAALKARALEDATLLLKSTGSKAEAHDTKKCVADHFKNGVEGRKVYVWRGPFKGKLGSIYRSSGTISRVSFDSAIKGNNVVDVPSECLVMYVI